MSVWCDSPKYWQNSAGRKALANGMTYSMPLEVYLQSALVRGILVTNQDRLSNTLILGGTDEMFTLKEATVELADGKSLNVASDEYLIYMNEVFLIADLSSSPRSVEEHLYVKKDPNRTLLNIGPYWVQGNIHLLPGAPLHDLLMAKTRFIPVTEATLIGCPVIVSRTYLVNRSKIGCMTALGDGLIEF